MLSKEQIKEVNTDIGNWLRQKRTLSGMSIEEAVEQLKGESNIELLNLIERGEQSIPLRHMYQLVLAYRVGLDEAMFFVMDLQDKIFSWRRLH